MTVAVRRFINVRTALVAAIVVLLGVLAWLGWLFVRMESRPSVVRIGQDGMSWVRSLYGYGTAEDAQFAYPYAVAIGPNGDVYGADPMRARVLVFSRFGEFKRLVHTGAGGTGPGQFIRPEAIEVDGLGNLYIADSRAKKVIVFDEGGVFLREWAVPTSPRGIAVDAGEVYVLGEGQVHVYNLAGAMVRQFGSRGKAPGQIDAYMGIAARDGRIYVADAYNRRIQAFDTNGTLAWANPSVTTTESAIPGTGTVETQSEFAWDLPQDLTFDGAGNLVVADAFRFQLVVVDPDDGSVVGAYGDVGRDDGEFYYPTGVAYDPVRDWFAVADTQNKRVQIVRVPGTTTSPASTAAQRVAASSTRYLAVPVFLLVALLAFSVYRWVRWNRSEVTNGASASGVDMA